MSTDNPYATRKNLDENGCGSEPSQLGVWTLLTCGSVLLPILLTFLSRWTGLSNIAFIVAMLAPPILSLIFVKGWLKLFAVGICMLTELLSLVLGAILEFMLYGFDGVH